MTERCVGLMPGQGAYQPEALRELRSDPAVAQVLAAVDRIAQARTGGTVSAALDRSATAVELLRENPDLLQLAVFATSVAAHELLRARSVRFEVLIGHSLGEIAALTCAGVFSVEQGAEIVAQRCAALRAAAPTGTLMAALGCDRSTADRVLALVDPAVLVAAENGPRQTVVTGPEAPVRTAIAVAQAAGIGAAELRSPHGFHHPALAAAQAEFAARLTGLTQAAARVPVYSPILRRFYRDADDLAELLARHLVHPVRFGETVELFQRHPGTLFVELGAGKTLTSAVLAAHPAATALRPLTGSVADLQRTVDFLHLAGAPRTAAPVPRPAPAPEPQPAAAQLGRDALLAEIRAMYATELEYPEDVFEEEAELEADLGVDSLKKSEFLVKLNRHYGLGAESEDTAAAEVLTFGQLVDLVHSRIPAGAHR